MYNHVSGPRPLHYGSITKTGRWYSVCFTVQNFPQATTVSKIRD